MSTNNVPSCTRLFIAEKPAMAQAIAKNMPGPHKRGDGYIETGAGIVTWAVGHILEQVPPEDYDKKYEKWVLSDLPIVPQSWKLQVSPGKQKQFNVIKSLLKNCQEVVNAGDPGREGQLIIDEIIEFASCKKPVLRILLPSLDPPTIKAAMASMQPNSNFNNLYLAAVGRQRADWIVGMNMTRAYTLLGRNSGYSGVLSVGRVQTPTLAIVVKRELEIENFKPCNYWVMKIALDTKPSFHAKHKARPLASGDLPPGYDEAGRLIDQSLADAIKKAVEASKSAVVKEYTAGPASEQAPLPFDSSAIQSKMSASVSAGVQDTLAACQSLYEKGYTSYPRTDCCYLPEAQHVDAKSVLAAIKSAKPDLSGLIDKADPSIKSRAWNDKKMGEHHAIIPTSTPPDYSSLTSLEKSVYDAVSLRFIAQFYPDCLVDKVSILLESGGYDWAASGRTIKSPGWRTVYGSADEAQDDDAQDDNENQDEKDSDNMLLPSLTVAQTCAVTNVTSATSQTKPPPRYTEGTLLKAMKHVDRLVSDPVEKKKLKNVEGIGRAATRPGIIGTLLKRGFIENRKKMLIPNEAARMLVSVLPKDLTDPGLTARWEHALDAIAAGNFTLSDFQQKQELWIRGLISSASTSVLPRSTMPQQSQASSSSASKSTYKPKSTTAKSSSSAKKSTPAKSSSNSSQNQKCSKCGKDMLERTVKAGPNAGKKFLGCSGYPACNNSVW